MEQTRKIYSFGDFRLDAGNRQLRRGGKPLSLPPRAFDLLVALVENNGRLVGKDELFNFVWGDQIVEESSLTVHISQIRKVLGETINNPRFIETVPGYGYRFIGDVSNSDDALVIETQTISRITIEEGEKERKGGGEILGGSKLLSSSPSLLFSPSKKLLAGGIVCLVAVIVVGFWFFKQKPENRGAATAPAVLAAEKQPKMKRLTNNGRVNVAVLSPDGDFFAYSVYERGKYRTEIRLGQTNGNSDIALVPKADMVLNPNSFSADGNWLYYVQSKPRESNSGTLYKIPVLPGGVPQKLASGISTYPAISPDEKQMAFLRERPESKTSALIVANMDGTNERELVVRPSAQAVVRGLCVAWSPDASRISFCAKNGDGLDIFTADAASGNVAQLTALEWNQFAKLEWLKDGSGLLAVGRGKNEFSDNQIWRVDYPSGAARKIISDLSKYGGTLSSAANSGVFIAVQYNAEGNIWVAPADNLKEAKQITHGSLFRQDGWYGLDWSPDGRIVYVARIDRDLTLWTMDASGENPRQITPVGSQDRTPTISADASFVVFESNRSGKSEIWRVRVDGGDLAQLTNDGGNSTPSFTPDGQTIVYQHSSNNGNFVRRVSLSGGEAINLIEKRTVSPRVSPDGKFIACGSRADGKMKLAIFSIEGGEPLKLFDVPPTYNFDIASIRWSPDSRFVAYRDWANGIWRQAVAGGEPKLLENLPVEKFFPFAWSPDGKHFAFTRGRDIRDVVLISDFR